MTNFKKTLLAAAATLAFASAAHAAKGDTADGQVVWNGSVPGSTSNGDIIIGDLQGTTNLVDRLVIRTDGTFEGSFTVRAYHTLNNAGDEIDPANPYNDGEVTWTFTEIGAEYGGLPHALQALEVDFMVAGSAVNMDATKVNSVITEDYATLPMTIKQTVALPADEVAGAEVQARIGLLATAKI